MLIDGVRFDDVAQENRGRRAIVSFLEFIERRLGVTVLYDKRRVPFGRADLAEPLSVATKLIDRGVVSWYGPTEGLPDEPGVRHWICRVRDSAENFAGGSSVDNDTSALFAALAEGLERYIWWTQRDYFVRPRRGTIDEMRARFPIIAPHQFVSFSEAQRLQSSQFRLPPEASYLWIEGTSLVSGKKIYVPAQTVSAAWGPFKVSPQEPLIRMQHTTGLATWPTRIGARLAGALECIERESYMIMWFNQLSLPRIHPSSLRTRSKTLDAIISRCERYGLRVHIITMLTDAPTHAVCAILEDPSPVGPRFAFGLKAHRSLADASEKAILEALRARRFTRKADPDEFYDPSKPVDDIGHRGRVHYWQDPEHARHLEFLVSGEEKDPVRAAWEDDTPQMQLERIENWCREKGYECVSVPLTSSKANPTPWHIEMILMPDLHPTHLAERMRHLGGERLQLVPRLFGYEPLEQPFVERPHPFC
ncbi:MAG TPA: YcaO-like family protein [Candidatus Paceibacterota bacterium]|nr:YcaO-like family protein [Candidatus Paceibacterota bacterium]